MKPKVAFVCESVWCMGRISEAVKKYLEPWYDVTLYDWGSQQHLIELFGGDMKWKEYDIITGNSSLDDVFTTNGCLSEYTPEFLDKCVFTIHCPLFDHVSFTERITHKDGPLWTGITEQVVDNIHDKYGVNASLTPIGVDPDHFYPTREIKTLRRAGWVGNPNSSKAFRENKRPELFDAICRLSGLEPVYLHGKDFRLNNKLYEDIDVLIVTSVFEGVATSIAEAGACDIPVIATNVGYAMYLKNIKTFETIDEAVDLIKTLDVAHYAKTLGEEIRSEWNWKTICEKYWKPAFDKRLIYTNNPKIKYPSLSSLLVIGPGPKPDNFDYTPYNEFVIVEHRFPVEILDLPIDFSKTKIYSCINMYCPPNKDVMNELETRGVEFFTLDCPYVNGYNNYKRQFYTKRPKYFGRSDKVNKLGTLIYDKHWFTTGMYALCELAYSYKPFDVIGVTFFDTRFSIYEHNKLLDGQTELINAHHRVNQEEELLYSTFGHVKNIKPIQNVLVILFTDVNKTRNILSSIDPSQNINILLICGHDDFETTDRRVTTCTPVRFDTLGDDSYIIVGDNCEILDTFYTNFKLLKLGKGERYHVDKQCSFTSECFDYVYKYGDTLTRYKRSFCGKLGLYKYVQDSNAVSKITHCAFVKGDTIDQRIQMYALQNLYSRYYDINFMVYDHRDLEVYRGPPVGLFCNGCFDDKPLPSSSFVPVFIGFETRDEQFIKKNRDYFKKYSPIGCRDRITYDICTKCDIPVYMSYCQTLGMNRQSHASTRNGGTLHVKECADVSDMFKLFDDINNANHVVTDIPACYYYCTSSGTDVTLTDGVDVEDVTECTYDLIHSNFEKHIASLEWWTI
jgi:hypothetical protein